MQELYNKNAKRYYLDDLKVYCKRLNASNLFIVERGAIIYTGFPGQRAIDLGSLAYFA